MTVKSFGLYFIWGLMISLVGGCQAPSQPLPSLNEDATILAFGDSLTLGKGSSTSYPEFLSDLSGFEVINAGISGETSTSAKNRFERTLDKYEPALVILCTGGNDFIQRMDDDITKTNIMTMVNLAKDRGIAVVLIAVPKISLIAQNHPLYDEIATDQQLWMEDDILKEVMHNNLFKSDQFHPNTAGYQKIAEAVFALLKESNAL